MCIRDRVSTCVRKGKPKGSLTTSDKIDRVVTNRWLALPIFVAVMAVVYYIAVSLSLIHICTAFSTRGWMVMAGMRQHSRLSSRSYSTRSRSP